MQDDTALASPSQPAEQRDYTLAAPMLRFDLGAQTEVLRRQPAYARGAPSGKTLVKEPDLRIVLMALKQGARLERHTASGPISVQPLQGQIRLQLAERSVELGVGDLLMLEPRVPHDVEGLDDAVFLLTIGRTTYHDVSDDHEPKD